MHYLIDVRISEQDFQKYLSEAFINTQSVLLGGSVRKFFLRFPSEAATELAKIHSYLWKRNILLVTGSNMLQVATPEERNAAEAFLWNHSWLKDFGEDWGTIYDDSSECELCGAGGFVTGPLILPIQKGQVNRLFGNGANERIVHVSIAQTMVQCGASEQWFNDVVTPSGREQPWKQLRIDATRELSQETLVGYSPFDLIEPDPYRCPLGHCVGNTLLGASILTGSNQPEVPFFQSLQVCGGREGLIRPCNLIFVTRGAYDVLVGSGVPSGQFEIALFDNS